MTSVNPLEGEVAIPVRREASGWAVGCLTARAMAWVEQTVGKAVPDIYAELQRRVAALQAAAADGSPPPVGSTLPVGEMAALLWAALEAGRRRANRPGPEFTIDDAYEVLDDVGLDDAAGYCVSLLSLSLAFRPQREAVQRAAEEAGEPDPFVEVIAAATAATTGTPGTPATVGTGSGTSPLPPPPG